MTVLLTKSFSALSPDQNPLQADSADQIQTILNLLVDSATVTVSYAGVTDTLFQIPGVPGIYTSLNTPQVVNETYDLTIVTKEGETLTSASEMLEYVPFDNVSPSVNRTTEDTTVIVDYTFTDIPGDNYYMVHFYSRLDPDTTSSDSVNLDINTAFQPGTNLLQATHLISDKTFGGSVYSDSIHLVNVQPNDSLAVTISNISEEYFNYLSLRKQASNWFTEIVQEPINYPSNIVGGYGFFNTHFPDVRLYDMNDF